jgi:organic hydroperoxide reductase OsmC/OhrA
MTVFESAATIRWLDSPPRGMARMTVGSGLLVPALLLSVDPEVSSPVATSPGELLAGSIGAIFAWFVAQELLRAGTQANELTADVTVTASGEGDTTTVGVSGISFALVGRVPKIGQERLAEVARRGMDQCVKTLGLRAEDLDVSVETVLEGA